MKLLALLLLCVVGACVAAIPANPLAEFKVWTAKYNKHYKDAQAFSQAFANFKVSMARIETMQKKYPLASFGLTKFADLSLPEFKARYRNAHRPADYAQTPAPVAPTPAVQALPTHFDWRDKKAVTNVKDQGQCGSCWAFSATENVESQWFLAKKAKTIEELAPQQIVDCDKDDGGCEGGWPYKAFGYLKQAGGQELEVNYPYRAVDQKCQSKTSLLHAKIADFNYSVPRCEDECQDQGKYEPQLQQSLYSAGPLSICINADPFGDYTGGIITNCDGSSEYIDHCVQLVGYNEEGSQKYWIVRNSWGEDWGVSGYAYIAMDGQNECGLCDDATFVIIPK